MASIKYDLPLIPLRDVVIFPGVVSTLFVGRNKSINALNAAMASEKKIILAAQKNGSIDSPLFDDLFKVATVANILQLARQRGALPPWHLTYQCVSCSGAEAPDLGVIDVELAHSNLHQFHVW